ncbi:Arc family DNA-binding protein [Pedomonas mirosovicensis]|uniref:Arc family DNA-binding protein n=1 Tax=Pedomonas mirosovicensis TaxID=2908641 RepID=UPI00216A1636|nr:Arc family DNA-binding protein [Pedomonas mirosovicensis]MCH8685877.1 Arc family DNA-binding protein [Pedomonas mirosovicensis]
MHTHDVQPTSLRLPTNLKSQLKDRAKANRRSLTGEIIAILERAMTTDANEAA